MYVRWMAGDGQIPNDLLQSELGNGKRNIGRLSLRYKEACKCDMRMLPIDIDDQERDLKTTENDALYLKNTVIKRKEVFDKDRELSQK